MDAFLHDFFFHILVPLVILVVVVTGYIRYTYGYWKRRGIPYLEPIFPFGNGDSIFLKGIFIGIISRTFYEEFKGKGHMAGLLMRSYADMVDHPSRIYIGMKPILVVLNPDWIKEVLIKDFHDFTDRGLYMNEKDPLSVHLATQSFAQWKPSRVKFTPLFTSARIKVMFETMLECSEGLEDALKSLEAQRNDVDASEVAACFATDVIGSCAFGIDCNSFKNPDAELRTVGRKFFTEFSFMDKFNLFLTIYTSNLAKKLGVRSIQKEVSRFFLRIIRDTVEYREKNNVRRNDLLQLLIDMKNSEVKLTMDELVGQTFVFFIGGFETSSTTTATALFEISKDENVQDKIREEIREVLEKYEGRITYDALAEMKYLGQAIEETLRLWPPVLNINRMCTKVHKLQNSDITVEKGTPMLISLFGLHRDPEYWPDPEKWDPDRFSEENRESIRPFTYLPFGEGPRNCIGSRFGLLQTKIALMTVLRNYRVSLSPNTVTPLGISQQHFLLKTQNKVYLRLEKI